MSRQSVFLAWLILALFGGGCDADREAAREPVVFAEPVPPVREDPPWAIDSVFRPETFRGPPLLPGDGLRARATIIARDAAPFSYFGQAAALDAGSAVVGAAYDDEQGIDAGAAYIWRVRDGRWVQAEKLIAPSPQPYDRFGFSVAVSGAIVVVGADRRDHRDEVDAGAAFVFRSAGNVWPLEEALRPEDSAAGDGFGVSVAAQRDTVLVGAPGKDEDAVSGAGAAYVFRRGRGGWRQEAKLVAPTSTENAGFGLAVALHGDTALVGAGMSSSMAAMGGDAYVFRRRPRGWEVEARLVQREPKALQRFGAAVALEGEWALIGAPRAPVGESTRAGSVFIFRHGSQGWASAGMLTSPLPRSDEEFGRAVSMAAGRLLVGSPFGDAAGLNTGSAWLFVLEGDSWASRGRILSAAPAALEEFGTALALSPRWILIGAPRSAGAGNAAGAAYLYDLLGGE